MNYLKEEFYQLLRQDVSFFNFIEEKALDGFWVWDIQHPENLWMSSKLINGLGYSNSPPISNWKKFLHPSEASSFFTNFGTLKEPLQENKKTLRYTHKTGFTVWMQCALKAANSSKNIHLLIGGLTDISKFNRTKTELEKKVERYEHIIKGTKIGAWEWNIQTGETIFSEQWANILGYSLKELREVSVETWNNFAHPKDRKPCENLLEKHFRGETEFYESEARMRHKSGKWIWVLDRGQVVSWTIDGKPEWMTGFHEEVTEKKNAFERNRLFIDQAPSAIAMLDTNMRYLAGSKRWLTNYNIKEKNLVGKALYQVSPHTDEKWINIHQRALQGERIQKKEDTYASKDGKIKWHSWEVSPWYTSFNEIGGVLIHSEDITERKKNEEKLRISEATFRGNFENAAVGMAMVNSEGFCIDVNKALSNIIGYTREEFLTLTFRDITHPEDLDKDVDYFKELTQGKRQHYHMEKRYFHKNGGTIYAILSVSIVRDTYDKALFFISQITDITRRKNAEKKLKEALDKMEAIMNASTQVSIIGANTEGLITSFNRGAENLLGYTKEEMVFKKKTESLHLLEEIKMREKDLSHILQKNKDKSTPNYYPPNEIYDTREWTYVTKHGKQFPVQLTITPIYDEGQIIGHLGIAADISEIKNIENQMKSVLEVTKNQNIRLKNFAHIVSHNLRTHAGNFSMLLGLFLDENPAIKENEIFEMMNKASENLNDTITHLNEVVSINTEVNKNMLVLNLRKSLISSIHSISALATEANVTIENNVDNSINILAVPAYLDSILINFLTNSIKYRSPSRHGYIKLSAYKKKKRIVLKIEDNGLGIDLEKNHEKLFGMYKTFHNHKDGRGIGLFITKNQVEAMGGKIEVESVVDKGTTFKVNFKDEEK